MKVGRTAWRWLAVGVGAVGVVAVAGWLAAPAPELVQGQVEVRRVNASAKIPGRIDSLLVQEGDVVHAGQLIAVLRSPELEAKARQADAVLEAAQAQAQKAHRGARREEVAAAAANWERARAAEELAATTYERVARLFDDGVVAEQRRDEARTQWTASRLATAAARAQYDMALQGAREEDLSAAAALVRQAEGGRAEVEAYASERYVVAPVNGEVAQRNAEPGEVVSAGLSIVTVAEVTEPWVTFNLREDRLGGLAIGDTLTVRLPALAGLEVALRVSYVAPLADFATWRATAESGGFDLRTFEVRARPVRPEPRLRAGMTALLRADRLKRS
jgi:HlyD family secretion protein